MADIEYCPPVNALLWDQVGNYWDTSDLTWDAGQAGGAPGDMQKYLHLVTSEHNQKAKFICMLATFLGPVADGEYFANALTTLFDIDLANGEQLDMLGLWIGRNRFLSVPITGVYFTFDDGPGFDFGILRGEFDPLDQLVRLPDPQYRTLLKATIAANHWDGSIPGAYAAYAIAFGPGGYQLVIVDHQNMTMTVILVGPPPDALTLALLLGGYLSLKPVGVRIDGYVVVTDKLFIFDVAPTSPIAGGFDVGAFATFYPGA